MKQQIFREITPLAQNKLFFAKFTPGDPMDFPLHFHDDYELTLVLNVRGKRIVGNLIEDFSDRDLVLIGSDEIHGYKWAPGYAGGDVAVIQFSRYAKDYQMFTKDILEPIGTMLASAKVGIKFSDSTTRQLQDDILRLPKMTGIDGVLLFLKILHDLAVSPGQTILSAVPIISDSASYRKDCDRIDTIIHFIESNYRRKISLEEIGRTVNMSGSYVCRFFKRKT